jgi:ketosteroid isomerase-like protein
MTASETIQTNQETIQATQDAYAAFGRGDIGAVMQALADDIDWTYPGTADVPYVGTRHGKQAVLEWFAILAQTVSFQRFEPYAFIAQGDAVVTLLHVEGTVRATGRSYSTEDAHVVTFKDGKIVRFRVYTDTAATAAAFAQAS